MLSNTVAIFLVNMGQGFIEKLTKLAQYYVCSQVFQLLQNHSPLTLSWQRSLSYRNQSIDLHSNWFYNRRSLRRERVNPFSTNVSFLYPLQTSENWRFSDVFEGYRSGVLIENGLNTVTMHANYSYITLYKICANISSVLTSTPQQNVVGLPFILFLFIYIYLFFFILLHGLRSQERIF